MRIPWRKSERQHGSPQETAELGEARRAAAEAERSVRQARSLAQQMEMLRRELEQLRQTNHFREGFALMMREQGRG